ncbi:MAG: alpha/beta hydrolase [Bacteroidia bacterium]|nr:MAG: alpha/beta hydrolase [Bacteroidia bacterium]
MLALNYKTYGDSKNPNLIILHGFLGSADNWHTLSKQFSEHFCVWTVDQRNHGRSPHAYEFNYDVLVDDLYEFIDYHKIEQPVLLGHSMGGKVVMQFAMYYPNLVNRLIVADMAPYAYSHHHQTVLEALQNVHPGDYTKREAVDEALSQYIPEWDTRQFIMKSLYYENGKYQWRFYLESLLDNYEQILKPVIIKGKTFEKPTCFIKGEKSQYISEERWTEILDNFPNATLKVIKDAGHWVHAEKPNEFYLAVMECLKK